MVHTDDFGEKDKVQILLEEYKMLRTEINTRTGYGLQVWVIAAAATTWLLGQSAGFKYAQLYGFAAILGVLFWFTVLNVRDIWKAAARTKEIEHEINSRAGEHLMVWERLFGAARVPFLAGLFSRIRPLPRSALPPLDPSYRSGNTSGDPAA